MCSQRDAASVTFNLPDYHVIDAIDLPLGGRRVIVKADTIAGGCPDCGVVSARVHAWCRQRVKDVPHAGGVEVLVVKPRLVCAEQGCPRRTFTQTTSELPRRARCTTRLRQALLTAVIDQGQPVAQVAKTHQVAWWTTQKTVNDAVDTLPDVDALHVKHLGIDEHRYRRVRWFRDPDSSGWRRVEPWMTTLVNTACGQVLGVVDGRDSAAVEGWLNPAVAGPHRSRRDRPLSSVQEGHHHQPPARQDRGRSVPPGPVGEPVPDPGAAAPGPGPPPAPGPEGRPGLGTSHPAAPRLRHPLGAGPPPAR